MYTFTVNDANTIEVFVEGQEAPMLRQPHYPNQDAFDTKSEAEEWAQLFITSMTDEAAPFAPIGKGIPGEPKPTKEEILERLKKQAEEYGDNVPEQLAQRIADLEAELAA
jgi:hypothetical protein